MSDTTAFKTVLFAGATGTLGKPVVEAFLEDGTFDIRVLTRQASAEKNAELLNSYKNGGATIVYGDFTDHNALLKALAGVDVVISVVGVEGYLDGQLPLIAAAREAGVRRFIPSEWAFNTIKTNVLLYGPKKTIHQALKDSGLEYTLLFPGLWPSLFTGFVTNINYDEHKIVIIGDGNAKVNFTTESDAGRWAVAALKKPELTRNREVVVAGDRKSWNEIAEVVERVTGHKFERIYRPLEKVKAELVANPPSFANMPGLMDDLFVGSADDSFDSEPWANSELDIGKTTTFEEHLTKHFKENTGKK